MRPRSHAGSNEVPIADPSLAIPTRMAPPLGPFAKQAAASASARAACSFSVEPGPMADPRRRPASSLTSTQASSIWAGISPASRRLMRASTWPMIGSPVPNALILAAFNRGPSHMTVF